MEVRQFSEVELFGIFNIDLGDALLGGMFASLRAGGELPTYEEYKKALNLRGHSLWHFRAKQRTSKVEDLEAMDPKELARKRRREQSARVEQMAALVTPQMAAEWDATDGEYVPPELEDGLAEQLSPPEWLPERAA